MRLLQLTNVGQICGGTAACAWSVTRSLPHWQHIVRFFSNPTPETIQEFQPSDSGPVPRNRRGELVLDDDLLESIQPDLILCHNTAPHRVQIKGSRPPLIVWAHSETRLAKGDLNLACSHWLARRLNLPVLEQPVPSPHAGIRERIIGRICSPNPAKWSPDLPLFYEQLARSIPSYKWEFVGAPLGFQEQIKNLLPELPAQGFVRFLPTSWNSRHALGRWDILLHHQPQVTESFGRTVAEALLGGTIPIVDRAGGFIEQVLPGSGFLCRSPEEFQSALARLVSEPDWEPRRTNCREAGERYSMEAFNITFQKLCQEKLGVRSER